MPSNLYFKSAFRQRLEDKSIFSKVLIFGKAFQIAPCLPAKAYLYTHLNNKTVNNKNAP